MPFDERRPEMSKEELHLLKDVFQDACGYVLREDLKFIAERRLAPRLEALGLKDFRAYHRFLRFDPKGHDELETAIDLLVPHETYFFREPTQLEAFTRELVPRIVAQSQGRKALTVWSAGCSTGEEPYTLSMLLDEAALAHGWEIDVLGTDLSRRALASARHAEYGQAALRATTASQAARYFDPAAKGHVKVKDRFRQRVRFGQLNLLDRAAADLLPSFDVVFCRNVLIYFDPATRKRVVDLFFDRLKEGGTLLLGHSENLFSLSTRFELVQLEGDLVYRKPLP